MSIRAAWSTIGKASPATVAEDAGRAGGYRYKGDPDWTPGDPRYRDEADPSGSGAGPEAHRKRRQDRIAAFASLVADLTPELGRDAALIEAAQRVGVGQSTAREYLRELKSRGTEL